MLHWIARIGSTLLVLILAVTGSASAQVLMAAKSLAGESGRLKLEVGQFLSAVRAA